MIYYRISLFSFFAGVLLIACQTVQEGPVAVEEPEEIIETITPEEIDALTAFIDALPIERKIGQMLFPALMDNRGNWATQLEDVRYLVSEYHVGGVILYRPNIISRDQITDLNAGLQDSSEVPLFISVDHEGGWVNRLRDLSDEDIVSAPSASDVGERGDADYAYALARLMADDLNSLHINMNLAPVADVFIDSDNFTIRHRSYGQDTPVVSEMVSATVRGHREMGVLPVLKHFPGHGSADADSHVTLPRSQRTRLQLQDDIRPFAAGLTSGAGIVMVSHVSFPEAFSSDMPSSISPEALSFLRSELSFSGVIMTDSLSMSGVSGRIPEADLYVQAVQAGEDILLRPASIAIAHEALLTAVEDGTISKERIDASVRRILELKITRGLLRIADDLSVSAEDPARRFSLEERETLIQNLR